MLKNGCIPDKSFAVFAREAKLFGQPVYESVTATDSPGMITESKTSPEFDTQLTRRLLLSAIGLLLLLSVPIFVCMPLTSDTVLYDLQARILHRGGMLYRDILEPNLPGAVWIHLLIRSLAGWSTEAMRMADLLIVGTSILLLSTLAPADGSRTRKPLFILQCSLFYLSRNEWCHCQRDSWLLLPVSLALFIRLQPFISGADTDAPRRSASAFILEGFCWGAAFWIKPHIALTVICLLGTEIFLSANRRTAWKRSGLIVLGGCMAAIPGILWLVCSGAWTPFMEMQLNWNPEYLEAGQARRSWQRVWLMLVRFHPWWMIHVIAIPVSLAQIVREFRSTICLRENSLSDSESGGNRTELTLSVTYLSWFLQAAFLQHAMDYIHVPPVLLGIVVLTLQSTEWGRLPQAVRASAATMMCICGILASPQLHPEALKLWTRCFTDGSTSEMKMQLACGRFPDWQQLAKVTDFLKSQHVKTGDVTCFNVHCIHAYAALNLLPSTRYVGISSLLELFPSRQESIRDTVKHCGARFVLTDTSESPLQADCFPGNLPVIFSARSFQVRDGRASPTDLTETDLTETYSGQLGRG